MIHGGILLSHETEVMPFATAWIDWEIIILSEVSMREKYDITYM